MSNTLSTVVIGSFTLIATLGLMYLLAVGPSRRAARERDDPEDVE